MEALTAICNVWRAQLDRKQKLASLLASSLVAALTGLNPAPAEDEPLKAPQTELITLICLGRMPSAKAQAPLATILTRHNGKMPAKDLCQRFCGIDNVDAFYAQLKTEVGHGWIFEPAVAECVRSHLSGKPPEMQLQRLKIGEFRNLKDLELNFATHFEPDPSSTPEAQPRPIRSHALIGQNGTGKSNLIEALITIFRDVDLDYDVAFDYELEYSIRGHDVHIVADAQKQRRPFVGVDGKAQSQGYLLRNRELLPSHVFAYYSGRNERMEELFQEHQRRFNRRQEITAEEVLPEQLLRNFSATEADIRAIDEVRKREDSKTLRQFGDDRLRRLFYCRGGHSQLVLLACLLSDDPVFKKVLANLHIEALESALFVLKQPHRLRELKDDDLIEGDARFWYARGNVVSEFLDKLWQVAWAPIEHETTKLIDFRGRRERQKQLYLFVPSQDKLRELGELVGTPSGFFRYAEGAYVGDLIDEVRITVKKREEQGGKVSFTQLSEGELQMLTVLGLMRITSEDHCLFLLDEPDTHLNPIWKLRYFDDIENVLTPREGAVLRGESPDNHHDPRPYDGGEPQARASAHSAPQWEPHGG